jgi:hypothetical protein
MPKQQVHNGPLPLTPNCAIKYVRILHGSESV